MLLCALEQRIEFWHWLHHLHTVRLIGKTFVNLQKRNNTFVLPQKFCRALTVDHAVHRHLKQNCAKYTLTRKCRTLNDASTHGMNEVVHLLVT